MLYTIIPPILVILSLAIIIIFLAKKAPQVARLDDEEVGEKEDEAGKGGFFQRLSGWMKNVGAGIGQIFLSMLEKLSHGTKTAMTRLESKSKNLNESMRMRRTKKEKSENEKIENNEDADIMNKIMEYQPEGKKKNRFARRIFSGGEKMIKPTISAESVKPRTKAEMKDRLEDLLIERIAANPKDSEAYERLGEYYMEIDSLIDAKECFKQVLKLDPKNGDVKYRMRRLETMMHKK